MFKNIDWAKIKDLIIEQLKGAAVKSALKKLLGSVAMGGFKAWLVKYVVTELLEEFAEPVARAFLLRIGYTYDRIEGKVKIKRINEAETTDDYVDASNDVFNRRRE